MKKKISILAFILMMTSSLVFAQSIYTVRYGDTLWGIAQKYNTTTYNIMKLNPQIKNPSMLWPGQKITVPSPNSGTTDTISSFEKEVIRLTNIERKKAGLPALAENPQLSKIARLKSQDMATKGYFSHQSPTYGSPFQMMQSFGLRFSSAGENIAYGQRTPQEVVNAWMNSPGHRANILSRSYSQIGVGLAKNSRGVYYWTQMFMQPTSR